MDQYNLSIYCVDGSIYGCISSDKRQLWDFLHKYDHEGSSLSLLKSVMGPDGSNIEDRWPTPEDIYAEIEWPELLGDR